MIKTTVIASEAWQSLLAIESSIGDYKLHPCNLPYGTHKTHSMILLEKLEPRSARNDESVIFIISKRKSHVILEVMKAIFRILVVITMTVCLFVTNIVYADVPAEQVIEVNHLLNFVKNSGCIINRNGTDHPAEKGVSHINKKYDYFRDDISSTEEFIEYSATKSTMSGDYYTVSCPGKKMLRTQDWLMDELKSFRSE